MSCMLESFTLAKMWNDHCFMEIRFILRGIGQERKLGDAKDLPVYICHVCFPHGVCVI